MRYAALLSLMLLACQNQPPQRLPELYGVIFRVQVAPTGAVEAFTLESIVDPFGHGIPTLDDDWLTAACMVFVAGVRADPTPTYARGESPKAEFVKYFYDARRPDAFFGEDPEEPVLHVPAGISEAPSSESGDVCVVKLIRPAV